MSVAALGLNGDGTSTHLASFSQRNDQVEIAAPGRNVRSTVPVWSGGTASSGYCELQKDD